MVVDGKLLDFLVFFFPFHKYSPDSELKCSFVLLV